MQKQEAIPDSNSFSKKTGLRPELLHALINSAQHGITIAEREGDDTILLYVNSAFENMTGYTAEECLYTDCRFLQDDDRDQPGVAEILESINERKPVTAVLRNYRKDGTLFWNEVTITPYFDETDGITYYIGVQKDISEQVALKEQLEAAEARLAEQK